MDHSKISSNHFKQYQNLLIQMGVSESTIKRKLASLRKFSGWLAHEGYLKENPFQRRASPISNFQFPISKAKLTFRAYRALPYFTYLSFLILLVFLTALGWGLYQQFVVRAPSPLAYPEEGVGPKRYLSFQGRLTDSNYTPIVTAVNMEFKLYDAAGTGTGTLLWESGVCSVDPDQDGIFALLLGTPSGEGYTCSSALEIPSHVFSENAEVWLETKVASETLSPRIQIATVAYALNAETLQGFPLASAGSTTPEATMGATARTVPAINPAGNLVIASDSPTIWSTSGTFGIKGQAISIQTDTGTGGNITLAPDGIGVLNIVPTSGNQIGGTINATNSALTTGALYTGRVENENTGFDFLRFFGGTTPTEKFSVGALGSIDMENNLDVGGAATITGTLKVDGSLISNLIPSGTRNLGSSGSNWDYLYINNLDAFTLQGAVTGNGQNITGLGQLTVDNLKLDGNTLDSTSGNLTLLSAGELYFDDTRTGAIPFSLADTTLNANLGQAIIDAINDAYEAAIGSGGISGFWTKTSGLLFPNNAYESIAIGGTSTASAKLYFEGTTGSASMSGQLTLHASGTNYINTLSGQALSLRTSTGGDAGLTDRLYISNAGNVGIGTTSPNNLLHVLSSGDLDVEFETTATGANYAGLMLTSPEGSWGIYTPSTGHPSLAGDFGIYDWGTTTYRFVIMDNGNVGIGTTSPTAKLDVAGDASTSGSLVFRGTSPATIDVLNGDDLRFQTSVGGDAVLTPRMTITNAGNVGIGTTSPGAKLDVAGNATISGTLALGPQTRAYAGNCDAVAEGKMYYDASADKYYYCDGGTWTEMGAGAAELWEAGTYGTYEDDAAVIVGADAAFSWADGGVGDLKVADQLEVVGDASISGTLTIGQGETIRPAYGPLQFAYKSGADAWTTGMVMTEQGNVGIGTTNPTSMLTLASSAPTFRMIDTTGSAKSLLLTVDGNLAVFEEAGGAADDLLVLDLANGRVGIGTTAPLTKLHVDGTTTGKALAIFNETGTNDILTASASGTTRLTLESSGNMTINREATESAYTETLSTNAFSGGGVAQSWNADDNYWEYDLPFDFPFFENIYNKIYISSNGEIYFSDPSKYALYYHTDFLGAKAIAPLWGNWTTAGNGQANEDIYITSSSTQLKIYWKGEIDGYPTDILNFEAILYKNGRIQFNYGSGNTNLQTLKSQHGKIGVSNGDYRHFYESSRSLQSSQTNSQTITFTPAWPVFDIQNKGETVFQANAEKATIAGDFSLGKTTMEPLTRTFTEETPEDRVLALVEDENFVYAGIGSDPPKVMRIDKRDHSTYTVKSLGIDDGWIRSLALDSQYLYAGTSTGKVIRINLSDFNTTTTKTFSESTSAIYGLAVDSTETYLYVGLNTSPGKILKIPINDFTGSYSVKTFNSGDNKVYSLIIDSSDTYLYAGLYLDPGRVVKLTLSDFSTTTTKTFASGEKYIRSLALDSSYLYAGCETSQSATGKIIRVLLSDFNTTTTKTLLTYQQVSSLAIDSSKTYLYAGLNKYPGQILKITIADFTGSHVTKTLSSDEDKVYALAIDSTYIYAGCWTFPGIVSKIPLGDFTGSSWDVLVFAQPMSFGSYRSEFVIDSTETYLYAVGGGYKGKIYRFDLDDFHNYTVKILDEGDNYPIGLAIDSTYLYASLGGYPSKIIRIKLADFTGPYDTKTLASGEDWAYDIVVDSTYLYAGCSTTPGKIVRLTLADFSTTSTKNLTNNNVYSLAIDSSSTYLYAGMDEYPGIIERLTLSDFNTTSTKTLTKNSAPHMAIDSNDTYLYIGHWDNAVTRLTLSDFNTTAVNNLPVDIYDYALDVAIDPDETYLYAGLSSWPGWVARINLANFTATADLYPTPCDDDDWTRCPAYLSVIAVDSKYVYAGSEYASPEGGIVRFALEARYISSQNYDLAIKTGNQNDEAQIYLDTNGNIFFGTAKSEIIRLLSDNVEIDAYETAIQGNLKVQGSSLFSGPAGFKFLQADELTIGTASARLTDYGAGLNITTKFLPGNDVASNSALTIDTDATLSSANLFSIKNNGTTKVVVDSSGNVGIGTTNPGAKLEVMSGSTTYNGEIGSFKITYNSDPTEQLYFGWDNSLGTYGSAYLQSVKSGTTYTPLLLNPAGGNVGITTNTPDAALDVGSGALKAGNGYAVGTRRGSNYRLDYSSCTMTNAVCGTCSWGVTFSSTPTAVCSTSGGATTQHDVGVSSSTTAATVCANDHSGTWSHTVVCIGFGPTTMTDFDLAESFKTNDQAIEPGEVVCIDPENNSHIVKCTKPYDATAIGIVSTEPGLIIGDELTPDSRLVGLQGRVPVKVTLENGPIERGDPLTPSATKPGFAMKAIKGGQIIGKAIQPFNGNSTVLGENAFDGISEDKIKEIISKTQATGEGQTMAFINVSWYDPDVYLTSAGELNIQMSPNENNPNESEYSLTDASGKIIERVGAFAEAAIAELQAGLIQTQELIADSLIVNQKLVSPVVETDQLTADSIQSTESKFGKLLIENEEGKTVASIDNAGNASFGGMLEASAVTSDQLSVTGDATVAGTLYAGEIVTKKGTFGDLLARVENLESSLTVTPTLEPTPTPSDTSEVSPTPSAVPSTSEVEAETAEATDSGLLADSESWPISDPSNDVQITDSLTVLGTSSLADTSVAGQLMVDATVIIDKDGIQTLPGSTLKLQAYGWGGIDMLDGKVTIDTQGNVLITGELTAGRIKTGGLILSEAVKESPLQKGDSLSSEESGFGKLLSVLNKEGLEVASIDASGSAFFAQLGIEADYSATQSGAIIAAFDNYYENGYLAPAIKTNATAGIGILPANEEEVMIYNPQVTGESLIYVTATTNTENKVLYVKAKHANTRECQANESECANDGYFIVALNESLTKDIQFNWWIIGAKPQNANER